MTWTGRRGWTRWRRRAPKPAGGSMPGSCAQTLSPPGRGRPPKSPPCRRKCWRCLARFMASNRRLTEDLFKGSVGDSFFKMLLGEPEQFCKCLSRFDRGVRDKRNTNPHFSFVGVPPSCRIERILYSFADERLAQIIKAFCRKERVVCRIPHAIAWTPLIKMPLWYHIFICPGFGCPILA